ncbi:MAG: DNA repair ATPase, partial [Planctomycetales bacterium]|nr:DNA repair ATPase [Planctomycetales bacterium]
IRQDVDTPHICHGQAFFPDGRMVSFRAQDTPQKHHAIQIWQTAWIGPDQPQPAVTDSLLYKIGNRDLVRGMAECREVLQLVDKEDSYADLYLDLIKRTTDILDGYFWIDHVDAMQLALPLQRIRTAAETAVSEYEKVVRLKQESASALSDVEQSTEQLLKAGERMRFASIDDYVAQLDGLRTQRGHALGLQERPYMDAAAIERLQQRIVEAVDGVGLRCVAFLLEPQAFQPFHDRLRAIEGQIADVVAAAAGRELEEQLMQLNGQLELLVETISQLRIDDVTQRTTIVDATGDVFAQVNRTRATLKARVRELLSGEMEADFASQTKLLDQSVSGVLETSDTPEKVDEALSRTMMQLEELEGRFAEFDQLLQRLAEKRASVYAAFEARREQLLEARSRRAAGLMSAADRILPSIAARAARLPDTDAQRAYFASDPLVDKVHQIAKQLGHLGDSVRQEDLLGRLKAIADDAQRQLRDRLDLFTEGEQAIRLGRHTFAVNRQPIELTTVVRNGSLQLHLTGTQFFQVLRDPALEPARGLWEQSLPSESESVYRAEFLAMTLLNDAEASGEFRHADLSQRTLWVRERMQGRHHEGYARGVHDHDAAQLLGTLLELREQLGLLRYSPAIRARTWLIWHQLVPAIDRERAEAWIKGFAHMIGLLPAAVPDPAYAARLQSLLSRHGADILDEQELPSGAAYLFGQIQLSRRRPMLSAVAVHGYELLEQHLAELDRQKLQETLANLNDDPRAAWILANDTIRAFLERLPAATVESFAGHRDEIALLLLMPDLKATPYVSSAPSRRNAPSLLGDHARIRGGSLTVDAHEFVERLEKYQRDIVPRYAALSAAKQMILEQARQRLRVHEFQAKVLTSFVRNQLIDEVYLPRVGDNLAKQLGAAGESKRTDRMGLLLLISPPGYGKTTLMEYIANRLGLVLVKINGPSLGHDVNSLDPAAAPNAAARAEIERINLALEMGDNVMLYLDDIQHCHPEFLQKFIPLCDGTRRMEGVWEGQPRT